MFDNLRLFLYFPNGVVEESKVLEFLRVLWCSIDHV